MVNNICKKGDQHNRTFSKVIRFGSELFSPLIPPPTILNITDAINPRDVILNRQPTFPPSLSRSVSARNEKQFNRFYQESLEINSREEHEIPLGGAITIGPAGYIETVRSPYSNYGDVFFDVSSSMMPFSIPSTEDYYGNSKFNGSQQQSYQDFIETSSILTPNSQILTTETLLLDEETHLVTLPPSSAILQSQLDNSSLDFFIRNNSFIEEIKSSLSVEQQQYINSGMTNSSSTNQCTTTTSPFTTVSDDMITRTSSENLNFQPNLTLYDDIFDNGTSEDDESDNCYSTLISPVSDYFSFDDECEDDEYSIRSMGSAEEEAENTKSRLQTLITKLINLINLNQLSNTGNSTGNDLLEEIKNSYITDINNAYIHNNALIVDPSKRDDELERLYKVMTTLYKKANNQSEVDMKGSYSVITDETNKKIRKRKCSDMSSDNNLDVITKRHVKKKTLKINTNTTTAKLTDEEVKKTRKNYHSDTINILMDWYLENDGRPPTLEAKLHLAELTGKSDIQISTWFQNARRRYQKKLEKFQILERMHPTLVYDYESLKRFMKSNRL